MAVRVAMRRMLLAASIVLAASVVARLAESSPPPIQRVSRAGIGDVLAQARAMSGRIERRAQIMETVALEARLHALQAESERLAGQGCMRWPSPTPAEREAHRKNEEELLRMETAVGTR